MHSGFESLTVQNLFNFGGEVGKDAIGVTQMLLKGEL